MCVSLQRATEHDREHALDALRDGLLVGAVSTDTFEHRVGVALGARGRFDLAELVRDLPARRRLTEPKVVSISAGEHEVLIGRYEGCDRVFSGDSVSLRHALLVRDLSGLRLIDLASTNGTWLNGVRIERSAAVRAGDRIALGDTRLILEVAE